MPVVTQTHLIQSRKDTLGGQPVIRDTRLKVETVLLFLADCLSIEKTLDAFSTLTPEDLRACLAFAAVQLRAAP